METVIKAEYEDLKIERDQTEIGSHAAITETLHIFWASYYLPYKNSTNQKELKHKRSLQKYLLTDQSNL
jgi:hypothetical protein